MQDKQVGSISHAHESFARVIGSIVVDEVQPIGDKQSSPDLVQLLVWNVLVAYFVSLGANATYPILIASLKSKGFLQRDDLNNAKKELDATIPPNDAYRREDVTKAVTKVLIRAGVPSDKAERAAQRVVRELEAASRV